MEVMPVQQTFGPAEVMDVDEDDLDSLTHLLAQAIADDRIAFSITQEIDASSGELFKVILTIIGWPSFDAWLDAALADLPQQLAQIAASDLYCEALEDKLFDARMLEKMRQFLLMLGGWREQAQEGTLTLHFLR